MSLPASTPEPSVPVPAPSRGPTTLAPGAVLAGLLCAAAFLRLGGLDHGVRRGSPAGDEVHNFVSPIRQMWSVPTANPGVKPGYPGFFNDLAFLPVGLGDRLQGERGAYVGARGLGAAFGLLSVWLVFRLCRSLAGPWPGVFAAGLMAFSRGEVVHAHFITPDLVVISGALLVLLLLRHAPLRARTAMLVGAVCGLTIAVKYTGVVVIPAVAAALVAERASLRRATAVALVAIASFAIAAPFAFLGVQSESGAGFATVVRDYYSATGYAAAAARGPDGQAASAAELASLYILQNVGLAGLGLAVAGLVLFRPRRPLVPCLAALVTAIAAILPAQLVYPRHVLVPSALLIVLAGCGVRAVHDRLRPAGDVVRVAAMVALAALVLIPPARTAFALAARFRGPSPLDQAASWIEKNVPGQPLVATGYPRLVLADRFEVRHWTPPTDVPLADLPPALLRHYDLVVGPAADLEAVAGQGMRWRVRTFDDRSTATAVAFPDPPSGTPVVPSKVEASEAVAEASGAWAGSSPWRSAGPEGWISGRWDRPRPIIRIELVADAAGGFTPQGVVLEGCHPDGRWRRLRVWPLRPRTLSGQDPRTPHGQVFILDPPADLLGLRVAGRGSTAWGLSRIAVFAEPRSGEQARMFRLPGAAGH